MPTIFIPGVGDVVLVDREQLRVRSSSRRLSIPHGMRGLMESIPPPPAVYDLSKNEGITFPILGNNKVGDCYYAAAAHLSQCWTGNAGIESEFNESQLIARYRVISGGDNGLSDSDIFPEFLKGIVGPNGPRKIIDWATVNPSDPTSVALGMWAFCGALWTCSLPSGWANNAQPGTTWGTGAGRSVGGHAMLLTGCNARGGYDVRTWGITPPINVTKAGLLANDPELILCFSLDMFNAQGVAPHCGANYDQLSGLWTQLTGHTLPPLVNPFPPSEPINWFV